VKWYHWYYLIPAFLLIGGFCVLTPVAVFVSIVSDSREVSTEEIFQAFNAPIPSQARNVVLEHDRASSTYVSASFQAAPQDAQPFIDRICDGALVQGYDPFTAEDSGEPLAGSVLMKVRDFVYYSRSPETPDTVWGLRCHAFTYGIHQLRVDKSDAALWDIRFEQPGGDCTQLQVPRCHSLGVDYANPLDDVPLMVVGLQEEDSQWTLVHPELCFEFSQLPVAMFSPEAGSEQYIGATMEIHIDDRVLPLSIVHQSYRLLSAEEFTVDSSLYAQYDIYWDQCARQYWTVGEHEVEITVTPVSGEREFWSFVFHVEDEVDANT
jgi:hypothetical protein